MKIYSLKRKTIPKLAVLATGLTAAVLVATINPVPAQAFPNKQQDCTNCHGVLAGTRTSTPSTSTPAAGATYTVAITISANTTGEDTGYWIANSTAAGVTGATTGVYGGYLGTGALTYSATMTAPAAAGTYYYKVWSVNGGTSNAATESNFSLYSITVGAIVTTPPVTTTTPPVTTTTPPVTTTTPPVTTTEPPVTTTEPPVTTTTPPVTTTEPPVTTTEPPVTTTEPPVTTTEPPVTTTEPPVTTTEPPVTTTTPPVTTTTPPVTTTRPPIPTDSPARILLLSPREGTVGTEVHIAGDFFGTSGVVKFGKVTAVASSWTENIIVVNVPAAAYIGTATLTVVPTGRSASNGISFTVQGPGTPVITDMGDLSPNGLIGTQHLGMYNKYPGNCASCHDGDYRPVAPVISWLTDTNMKLGKNCSSCHTDGKKTPLFITQMNKPAIAVYGRCSDCHQFTSKK